MQSSVANSTVITLTTHVSGITFGVLVPMQLHMLNGVTGTTKTTLHIIRLASARSCPNLRPQLNLLTLTKYPLPLAAWIIPSPHVGRVPPCSVPLHSSGVRHLV